MIGPLLSLDAGGHIKVMLGSMLGPGPGMKVYQAMCLIFSLQSFSLHVSWFG